MAPYVFDTTGTPSTAASLGLLLIASSSTLSVHNGIFMFLRNFMNFTSPALEDGKVVYLVGSLLIEIIPRSPNTYVSVPST